MSACACVCVCVGGRVHAREGAIIEVSNTTQGLSNITFCLKCPSLMFTSFTRFPQFETLNELLHETD